MAGIESSQIDRVKARLPVIAEVGGKVVQEIVGEHRTNQLWNIVRIIDSLGQDITDGSNIWENKARNFVNYVTSEAMRNTSLKVSAIGHDSLTGFEVRSGRDDEPRLAQMQTVIFPEGSIQITSPFKQDRRFRLDGKPEQMNSLQYIVLNHNGRLIDWRTKNPVENMHELRDEMPPHMTEIDSESRMIYLSRYILNLIRGHKHINLFGYGDEVMPKISVNEMNQVLLFASSIPDMVIRGELNHAAINEFINRMMSSFMINPRLFINLSKAFNLESVFPYFEKFSCLEYKFFENPEMANDSLQEIEFIRSIMGNDYDESLSILGNVVKMFVIGRFGWEEACNRVE